METAQLSDRVDALVSALTLSITAQTDTKSAQAVELANYFAAGMDAETVERAKTTALDTLTAIDKKVNTES